MLLFFILVVLFGSSLNFIFKKFPRWLDAIHVVSRDHPPRKVNVNTATRDELVALPYIGEVTAANLIRYRETHGPFTSLKQLKAVKGIKAKNFERFVKYLKPLEPGGAQ